MIIPITEAKSDLAFYYHNKLYLEQLEEKLDDLLYEMQSVKGVDYGKIKGSYNENIISARFLALCQRKSKLEKEINYVKNKIERTEKLLDRIEKNTKEKEINRALIEALCCGELTYSEAAENLGINISNLFTKINKILEEAIEDERGF